MSFPKQTFIWIKQTTDGIGRVLHERYIWARAARVSRFFIAETVVVLTL